MHAWCSPRRATFLACPCSCSFSSWQRQDLGIVGLHHHTAAARRSHKSGSLSLITMLLLMCLSVTVGGLHTLTMHAQDAAKHNATEQTGMSASGLSSSLRQASSCRANFARSMMQTGSACSLLQLVQSVICYNNLLSHISHRLRVFAILALVCCLV